MPTYIRCEHIQFNGSRCGSSALRGDTHCYHHQRYKQSFVVPGEKNYPMPPLHHHLGRARLCSDILRALLSGAMPVGTARTMLKAYRIATKPYLSVRKEKKTVPGSRTAAPAEALPPAAPSAPIRQTPGSRG